MLAKKNRLVSADDYRSTVRRGRRQSSVHLVGYWNDVPTERHPRVGFIVSKSVGNAVVRNTVRRRLKSISRLAISEGTLSSARSAHTPNLVIRALPGAAQADWDTLKVEVSALLLALQSAPMGSGSARSGSTRKVSRVPVSGIDPPTASSASAEMDADTRTATA